MRRTKILILATFAMLVLSGCFKFDMALEVKADDTIDGTFILAMDEEIYAMMEGEEDSPFEDAEDLPEGATVEEYREDGKVGQKITFKGVTFEEMSDSFDDEGEGFSVVRNDDGTYEFNGVFDMSDAAGGADEDLGLEDDELDMGEMDMGEDFEAEMEEMMAMMFRDAEFKVSVAFPGDVIEHNGEIDGKTVTWNLDFTGESVTTMHAKSEEASGAAKVVDSITGGGDSFPIALVVGGGLLLLLLAGGAFVLLRRKSSNQPDAGTDVTI